MKKQRRDVLRVSDHALLRFLERAGGFDVEALRTALEGSLKRATSVADTIGAREVIITADGLRYVVVNCVVVTITEPKRR